MIGSTSTPATEHDAIAEKRLANDNMRRWMRSMPNDAEEEAAYQRCVRRHKALHAMFAEGGPFYRG